MLWAFAGPEVASTASIAHVEAVAVALEFLERRAAATRQQVDGERQRVPTGLAAATFVHRTSREGDPQLHTHTVVVNLGTRPDGTFAALDATPLYEWGKAAGSVYQEELRRRLTERLGVEWGPDRNGCREMVAFDPGWLRTFSKRTVAIEEHLAGAGPENPDPKTRMKADDAASLATRPRKDGSLTPEVLRERWQAEADDVGLPTGHALEAQVCDRVNATLRPHLTWRDVVDALVDPEEGLCARQARFGEAHVVERVAALGAGRLDVDAIEDLAEAFVESDDAVRLVDRTGRRSLQFSTMDHLHLEGRVLSYLDDLTETQVVGIDETLVREAIAAEAPGLGDDQAEAVRALCAPGPAIRTLIAPAGFGKTTTVHAAVVAVNRAGYAVVGLAATNQAANELRQAGIPAMTIARFDLDGAVVPPHAVVVLDEISQVATADAEMVVASVASSLGARLWCLGDPHQAQAVRAGGVGAELARLGNEGRIPAAQLTENRRQLEAAERRALAHYRAGHIALSQAIRSQHGWEHDLGSPHATREALADAVAAGIATHGARGVVALAVAHADCEDLADRIRARLRDSGHIHGPEIAGPAWYAGERRYAAGDRILLHGTLRAHGQHLHNGSVVTVRAVMDDGLRAVDDHGTPVTLPRSFIEGHRSDGSPNCSHAWARTVDGIQGGTWPQVHLLGTAALERFTGYTGQSRSRHATHTWNVTRLPDLDHGGILADDRSPDREVLDALHRVPDTGFATHDNPARIRALVAERDEHRTVLGSAPPDQRRELDRAQRELRSAKDENYWAKYRLDAAYDRLDRIGGLSRLSRKGRQQKTSASQDIERFQGDVGRATDKVDACETRLARLADAVAHGDEWHAQNDWRHQRLVSIERELTDLGHIDLRTVPLPDRSRDLNPANGLSERISRALGQPLSNDAPEWWANRHPEIASPPLPGHDSGLGMDIGL